jgi:hypothetical protein
MGSAEHRGRSIPLGDPESWRRPRRALARLATRTVSRDRADDAMGRGGAWRQRRLTERYAVTEPPVTVTDLPARCARRWAGP